MPIHTRFLSKTGPDMAASKIAATFLMFKVRRLYLQFMEMSNYARKIQVCPF
jgi:hypothetical protein